MYMCYITHVEMHIRMLSVVLKLTLPISMQISTHAAIGPILTADLQLVCINTYVYASACMKHLKASKIDYLNIHCK